MAFRVGERVVYIGSGKNDFSRLQPLVPKQIYTVRSLLYPDRRFWSDWNRLIIAVNEVVNPPDLQDGIEPGYYADTFRPLVTRSQAQDIAMIRELVETIDPIVACELTYADEIEARMERIDRLWEAMR